MVVVVAVVVSCCMQLVGFSCSLYDSIVLLVVFVMLVLVVVLFACQLHALCQVPC